jgi:hypothetical protein
VGRTPHHLWCCRCSSTLRGWNLRMLAAQRSVAAGIGTIISRSRCPSGPDQISLPPSDFVPKSLPLNSEWLRLN